MESMRSILVRRHEQILAAAVANLNEKILGCADVVIGVEFVQKVATFPGINPTQFAVSRAGEEKLCIELPFMTSKSHADPKRQLTDADHTTVVREQAQMLNGAAEQARGAGLTVQFDSIAGRALAVSIFRTSRL